MKKVQVLIISGEGLNCDQETARAFQMAGAQTDIVPLGLWLKNPKLIFDYQILALPGGFSYGDELHSGQIFALDLKYQLAHELEVFISKKGLILGICNGFQILMKLGVFENKSHQRAMTLYHNDSYQFINRWVQCQISPSRCIWTKGLRELFLPIRHAEGRVIFDGDEGEQNKKYQNLLTHGQVALVYEEDCNGSYAQIAGLTDITGQIFGLMPHPEAALDEALYPIGHECPSHLINSNLPLQIFKNAVDFSLANFKENL
jgi:phosphoribosylformylglycinamidine synthase I